MEPIKILKSTVEVDPYIKWNTMIDLVAINDYSDMNQIQKYASLCFRYDSQVQNGGHIQYFTNLKGEYYSETLIALDRIGAKVQKEILQRTVDLFDVLKPKNIKSKSDFIKEVLVGYDYRVQRR